MPYKDQVEGDLVVDTPNIQLLELARPHYA